jgi:hypothetical protein
VAVGMFDVTMAGDWQCISWGYNCI